MLGVRLTEKSTGHPFQVVGADGSRWVIARTDAHEPPESVTVADLTANFAGYAGDAPVPAPEQPDEQAGWSAIGRANAQLAEAQARGATPASSAAPSPEEHFARIGADDAARLGHRA